MGSKPESQADPGAIRDPLPSMSPGSGPAVEGPTVSQFRKSPHPNVLANPRNILQHCEGWQSIAGENLSIMAEGGNPAEIIISYDVNRDDLKRTALVALDTATFSFCFIASGRYDWFNPKPLWEFVECVQVWASGTVSVRAYSVPRVYSQSQVSK